MPFIILPKHNLGTTLETYFKMSYRVCACTLWTNVSTRYLVVWQSYLILTGTAGHSV